MEARLQAGEVSSRRVCPERVGAQPEQAVTWSGCPSLLSLLSDSAWPGIGGGRQREEQVWSGP